MNKGYIYVSISILFWSTTATAIKLLLINLNNIQVLFYSSLIGAIALFIISLLQGKKNLIRSYSKKDYRFFILMGFLGVFSYYTLLYGGLQFSTAQEAFIINYTWPLWVIVFSSLILKEKLNTKAIFAILIGFFGVYLIATKGNLFSFSSENLFGNMLAFSGAIFYGLFSALGKKYEYEKFTSMTFYFLFGFLFTAVFSIIFSNIAIPNIYEIIGLIYIGIFPSAIAFVFWFKALKEGETPLMSNLVFLTPFISLIFISLILKEEIKIISIIGLILIIGGIVLQKIKISPKNL